MYVRTKLLLKFGELFVSAINLNLRGVYIYHPLEAHSDMVLFPLPGELTRKDNAHGIRKVYKWYVLDKYLDVWTNVYKPRIIMTWRYLQIKSYIANMGIMQQVLMKLRNTYKVCQLFWCAALFHIQIDVKMYGYKQNNRRGQYIRHLVVE